MISKDNFLKSECKVNVHGPAYSKSQQIWTKCQHCPRYVYSLTHVNLSWKSLFFSDLKKWMSYFLTSQSFHKELTVSNLRNTKTDKLTKTVLKKKKKNGNYLRDLPACETSGTVTKRFELPQYLTVLAEQHKTAFVWSGFERNNSKFQIYPKKAFYLWTL